MTSFLPSSLPATVVGFVGTADQLHAVLLRVVLDRALAAAAGVDLGLHDGERAAQLLERGCRFVRRCGDDALRHGDAGRAQQLLGLIFVNLHAAMLPGAAAHDKADRLRKGCAVDATDPAPTVESGELYGSCRCPLTGISTGTMDELRMDDRRICRWKACVRSSTWRAKAACLVDPSGWRVVYANAALLRFGSTRPSRCRRGKRCSTWFPNCRMPRSSSSLAELAAGERGGSAHSRVDCVGESSGVRSAEVRVRRVESEPACCWRSSFGERSAERPGRRVGRREGIDPLTGLADRAFILDRLSTMLHGDRSDDQRCAVLFIDVDGFKQVNDAYGHLVGDRVLCEVARRLAACVRAGDHVARFGGDEFVVLLERVGGRDEIEPVVRRIQAAFERPIALPQGEVTLGVSVGAARGGRRRRLGRGAD